jgi:ankyrin repeat protein
MTNVWLAASRGDVGEVGRLVGRAPGLLDARISDGRTPLMLASRWGHVGVVRWLLDKGAAINERDNQGCTAVWLACHKDHPPVVRVLMERGADPTFAQGGWTPLVEASFRGHLEVVRSLLGHSSGRATLNYRDPYGKTALWVACDYGRGGVARALLESGAIPTIADSHDRHHPHGHRQAGSSVAAGGLRSHGFLPRAAGSAWRRWR